MRQNPAMLAENCRTLLIAGLPYPMIPQTAIPASQHPTGRISAYACGKDYHTVIPSLFARLLEGRINHSLPTDSHLTFTDSAPILERDLGQRAGAGWIGRNTHLIRPGEGSYFFLAEALVNIDLEPEPPFTPDYCGTCQRCIQACPTGCILPNRTINAGRCISYLTIENRAGIPRELRSLMGNWIFGCDACQQVCPWNRFARTAMPDSALHPRLSMAFPDLLTEVQLSPEEFRAKYQQTPILRAKHRGYLRNVVVALGNAHDAAATPYLANMLEHDPDSMIRAHAAWALGAIGSRAARETLEKRLRSETDAEVIVEVKQALQAK
jgi:epoxyqueuosine reductase